MSARPHSACLASAPLRLPSFWGGGINHGHFLVCSCMTPTSASIFTWHSFLLCWIKSPTSSSMTSSELLKLLCFQIKSHAGVLGIRISIYLFGRHSSTLNTSPYLTKEKTFCLMLKISETESYFNRLSSKQSFSLCKSRFVFI